MSWNWNKAYTSHGLSAYPDCWSHPQSLGHCISPIRLSFSPPSHTLHQTFTLDLVDHGPLLLWPQASSLGSSLGALELKIHHFIPSLQIVMGFPGCVIGKEPPCHCRWDKRHGFDPWVGKIPWRRAWQPTPVFLPGESHGERSLAGYSP